MAKLIFESGDIDRAYAYMKNAMEDAILCNARINTIEASDMYLFIDKAFKRKKNANLLLSVAYSVRCALFVSYYLYFSPN